MVKLAQQIGASNIAQSIRQPLNMSSAVIQVRQNIYQDTQFRDAIRVMPFTDISYAGADVASSNSVIASCYVPMATGITNERNDAGMTASFAKQMRMNGKQLKALASEVVNDEGEYSATKAAVSARGTWLTKGFGMVDYLMGINQTASASSMNASNFNATRLKNYRPLGLGNASTKRVLDGLEEMKSTSVDGTYPIKIMQWSNDDKALDFITKNASEMVIGYVIGPRDVKLYYTETALSMMVRRTGRLVEALGPGNPMHAPIGLGHLVSPKKPKNPRVDPRSEPWVPLQDGFPTANVSAPTLGWNAGNVTYGHRALPAAGSLYIPNDQVPYSQQKRGYKYNHMLLQAGLELFEVLSAIGADLDKDLEANAKKSMSDKVCDSDRDDCPAGADIAALQILFSSMFGTVVGATNAADFAADEAAVASGMKEMMGFLFNSGHIHVDPGVLSYNYTLSTGLLSTSQNKGNLTYKGEKVSAQLLMQEFCAKYVTFCMLATALRPYFSVPTWQCHWLYVGSPKPEYVTEQLQFNFRGDVYYDGSDATLPYTLIPSMLNPGQVLARVPCLFDMHRGSASKIPNSYLGIRDPQPYGPVDEIRFYGDKPMTVIEEREYTFSPIIEADASIQSTYRNGRTVNMAVWPRPSVYSPGASRLGVIYGCLADNSKVGGHYYYQYLSGPLQNESVGDVFYRGMSNDNDNADNGYLVAGQGEKEEKLHMKYWAKKEIPASVNPQKRATQAGIPMEAFIPNDSDEDQISAPLTSQGMSDTQ